MNKTYWEKYLADEIDSTEYHFYKRQVEQATDLANEFLRLFTITLDVLDEGILAYVDDAELLIDNLNYLNESKDLIRFEDWSDVFDGGVEKDDTMEDGLKEALLLAQKDYGIEVCLMDAPEECCDDCYGIEEAEVEALFPDGIPTFADTSKPFTLENRLFPPEYYTKWDPNRTIENKNK